LCKIFLGHDGWIKQVVLQMAMNIESSCKDIYRSEMLMRGEVETPDPQMTNWRRGPVGKYQRVEGQLPRKQLLSSTFK
jgi:hypothetical protein